MASSLLAVDENAPSKSPSPYLATPGPRGSPSPSVGVPRTFARGECIDLRPMYTRDSIGRDPNVVTYRIEKIYAFDDGKFQNDEEFDHEKLPDLMKESTNKWLFWSEYKGRKKESRSLNLCIAIVVILLQVFAYITLAYYLIQDHHSDIETRAETCHGPNCDATQRPCMHISTGGVTMLLFMGFLWCDIIDGITMLYKPICGSDELYEQKDEKNKFKCSRMQRQTCHVFAALLVLTELC